MEYINLTELSGISKEFVDSIKLISYNHVIFYYYEDIMVGLNMRDYLLFDTYSSLEAKRFYGNN